MVLNLILVSMAVFGLRGIYFALVHESGVHISCRRHGLVKNWRHLDDRPVARHLHAAPRGNASRYISGG